LALEYLLEQLHSLALQSLHGTGQSTLHQRYYLELTAKAYLALWLGRSLLSIGKPDWRHLPEQVRGVLEAS
jgi:hypothetical protein